MTLKTQFFKVVPRFCFVTVVYTTLWVCSVPFTVTTLSTYPTAHTDGGGGDMESLHQLIGQM